MQIMNISEAKANLSLLIKQVRANKQPIIIGKAGNPVAILSPYEVDSTPRHLGGSWEGNVRMSSELLDAEDELIQSFYNSSILPESNESPA